MKDLFAIEQKVLDNALLYATGLKNGVVIDPKKYDELVGEYGRLLKQFRKLTVISDRATVSLNTSKHDLLDKVYYDALTGIYNRRFLEENMKRITRALSRSDSSLTVLMVDIDFLKKYNDTY